MGSVDVVYYLYKVNTLYPFALNTRVGRPEDTVALRNVGSLRKWSLT